jgi:hypothetical protein
MRWLVLTMLIGCSNSDGADEHTFHDAQNHTCTIDSTDLSATASCDIAPSIVCLMGQSPVWEVTPDVDTTELQVCQGCQSDTAHSTAVASDTCVDIVCATADDCIYADATCDAGICKQP